MDISEAVKFYSDLHFAIIPAVYGEKRPSVEWKKYQEKGPTKKEIKEWFKDKKERNIAILCGVPSANLVVLDFDDITIYPKLFDTQALERETLVVKTGSGKRHVYLRSDKPVTSFRIPQLKLEVRSDGNVAIAPPSKHPSGGYYEFVTPDIEKVMEVSDLVSSIWKKAEKLGVKTPTDLFTEDLHERGEQPYEGPTPPCIVTLSKGVEKGIRNEGAMRLLSYWLKFKRDVDPVKAWKRLKKWNELNKPPLPNTELKALMESAKKLDRSYGCRVNQAWCNLDQCALLRNKLLRKEAEEEAEKILVAPNVLEGLKPHLDNILAGEDDNKKLEYVLLSSGKLEDPTIKQMVLLKSEPGAGKSHLMRLADAFKTKSVGRFSAHALDYSNLQDYEVLRLKELGGMDQEFQGVSTIKFLSSDDRGYTVEVTERDEKGRFTTKQYRVPPITIITSTTRVELDPQFERRAWILNPDESKEQTNRIRKWKAKLEREKGLVSLGLIKETTYDHSMRVLRAVAKKIEQYQPILMFPESLTRLLKSDRLRLRGDFDKIMGLVKLHALLESYHLPKAEGKNGCKVVFVTPQSAFTALKVALKPFVTMTTELEERSRKLLEILEDLGYSNAGDAINHETRGKIAVRIGRSDRSVYRYFKEWCNAGYMSMSKDTSLKGNPVTFKLLYDLDFIKQKGAVTLDITNATTELGLDMQKEIESCLDHISDKITFTDGWSKNKVKEAMTLPNEIQNSPTVQPILSKITTGEESGLVKPTEKATVVASPMSKIEGLDSKKKLALGDIVSKLKGEWKEDLTQEEIITQLTRLGLTEVEAKSLFNQLAGNELFWYDKGDKTLWRWVGGS